MWGSVAAAAVLLLGGGVGYRIVAAKLHVAASESIVLDPPLSAFPLEVGAWTGEDLPLAASILRIANPDDYLSRRYVNVETGEIVSLYVTYTARPRTMLGHRPAICYIASGWVEEQTTSGEVAGADLQFPCLMQRFRDPGVSGQRQVVLSYYVLNGQPTIHEDDFRSVRWRGPNLRRDSARYVAQVQIAAPIRWRVEAAEQTAREFAAASVEGLLVLLPGGANDAVADARGDRLPGGDEAVGP